MSLAVTVLISLLAQTSADLLHFVTSPRTPFNVSSLAPKAISVLAKYEPYDVKDLTSVTDETADFEEGVVLDYTYDKELSAFLKQHNSNVLVRWPEGQDSVYGDVFSRYIEALHFTRVTLVSDSKQNNVQLSQFLIQAFPSVYEEMHIIPYDADEDFCLHFVGERLKPSGANLFAIVTDEVAAMSLLSAFETKKLDKEGYAYVLSSQASYFQNLSSNTTGLLATGILYVTDALTAFARSLEEAEEFLLKPILEKIANDQPVSDIDKAINRTFVLVNLVNSVPRIVASFPEEVGLNGLNISFPGNTSIVPCRAMAVIQTSVNYIYLDSTGYILPQSRIIMRGVQMAFEEVRNSTNIIPNFIVNDYSLSLSGMSFNYIFTKQQVQKNIAHLGVIHISPPMGANIVGAFAIFAELNLTKPITGGSGSTALASPKNYPMFVRAKTDNSYTALVMARMFQYFGWQLAAILYSKDNGDNQDFYNSFMSLTSTFGINITNNETLRILYPDLNSTRAQLNASITEIMKSSVRIVILSHTIITSVLEAMYDLGVRSDYLIVTWFGMSYGLMTEQGHDIHKLRTVGKGAIQVYATPFIGEQGQKVLKYIKSWDGMFYYPNTCYFYDSTMLYMYSTDYMLHRGIDYEDPEQIMKAMRGTRFTGCGGTIHIAPESNNRAAAQFSLLNVKYYEGNDTVVVEDVMYYNPFSCTLYQRLKPIMWPDNSTVYTDKYISNFHCPFLEKITRNFTPGVIVGFVVSFVICGITGLSAFLIWKRWWCIHFPTLKTKCEISADDLMQLGAVPLEFLQFAAAGPNSQNFNSVIAGLCASTALDFETIVTMADGIYLFMLNGVLGVVGAYVVLCVVKFTKLEEKLEILPLFSFLMLWADLGLPVLSNVLFFPIISALSDVFLCYRSIGESFTSSYLNNNCYEFCWQGSHITYAVLSSIALVIYIPLGIFTKPLWQEMQPNLHIRAQPQSLMVKSFVQVLLLTLSHTLRSDYPGTHAGLYFTVVVCYIGFLIWFRQYNYDR